MYNTLKNHISHIQPSSYMYIYATLLPTTCTIYNSNADRQDWLFGLYVASSRKRCLNKNVIFSVNEYYMNSFRKKS